MHENLHDPEPLPTPGTAPDFYLAREHSGLTTPYTPEQEAEAKARKARWSGRDTSQNIHMGREYRSRHIDAVRYLPHIILRGQVHADTWTTGDGGLESRVRVQMPVARFLQHMELVPALAAAEGEKEHG